MGGSSFWLGASYLLLVFSMVTRVSSFVPGGHLSSLRSQQALLLCNAPAGIDKETLSSLLPWYTSEDIDRQVPRTLSVDEVAHEWTLADSSHAFLVYVGDKVVGNQEQHIFSPIIFDTWLDVVDTFQIDEKAVELLKASTEPQANTTVSWLGSIGSTTYWMIGFKSCDFLQKDDTSLSTMRLREFGDVLGDRQLAGVLATANALHYFHANNVFCSKCGCFLQPTQWGNAMKCSTCPKARTLYPRMDGATIMLITSPCQQYALLGRKAAWPSGRYSTLAGFCQVGETLEQCVVREVSEESGVVVDPSSLVFVASQPWPFPQSLMVGFQARAVSLNAENSLPLITVDETELEDVQWFSKSFVKDRLEGGSTALASFEPNEREAQFHIPGRSSLARILITKWALSKDA